MLGNGTWNTFQIMRGQEDRPQMMIFNQGSYGRGYCSAIPSHHEELPHRSADPSDNGVC